MRLSDVKKIQKVIDFFIDRKDEENDVFEFDNESELNHSKIWQ